MNSISDKDEEILEEIYETLEKFFICPFNENGGSFRNKVTENIDMIEKLLPFNNPKALLLEGILYEYGIHFEKNTEKAKYFYEKSGLLGDDSYALFKLGIILDNEKKYKQSFECFEKSANKGNSYGINAVGYNYNEGIGCVQNLKMSFEIYEKASKLGNAIGRYNLKYKNY